MKEDMNKRIEPNEWDDPQTEPNAAIIALGFLLFFFIVGICFDHWFIVGVLHV